MLDHLMSTSTSFEAILFVVLNRECKVLLEKAIFEHVGFHREILCAVHLEAQSFSVGDRQCNKNNEWMRWVFGIHIELNGGFIYSNGNYLLEQ